MTYTSLQDVVDVYYKGITKHLNNAMQHKKFTLYYSIVEFKQKLIEQKMQDKGKKIFIEFTILASYPGYVIIGYTKTSFLVVVEFIKVLVNGFLFHGQEFGNLETLVNYEYPIEGYIRYLYDSVCVLDNILQGSDKGRH